MSTCLEDAPTCCTSDVLTKAHAEKLRGLVEELLDVAEADLMAETSDPVVAVAHAWFVRTVETVRAILLLHDQGDEEVAAPLLRTALGHAVGVAWIDQAGPEGLISLARAQRKWAEDVRKAVDLADSREDGEERHDWSTDMKELLADVIARDLPTSKLDVQLHQLARFQAVRAYDLFVAWLSETGYSHASDASAQPYVVTKADRLLLLARSRRAEGTLVLRCAAVAVMACRAIGAVLASDVWAAKVAFLDHELGVILEQARSEGWAGEATDED